MRIMAIERGPIDIRAEPKKGIERPGGAYSFELHTDLPRNTAASLAGLQSRAGTFLQAIYYLSSLWATF